jgi:oligosaccharyltransferase complex subunit delta (ribophorin II)
MLVVGILYNGPLVLQISLQEPEHETVYVTGGRNTESVIVTGLIKVNKAEIGISDNDAGTVESVQKYGLEVIYEFTLFHLK